LISVQLLTSSVHMSTSTSLDRASERCRLSELPPELRDLIYKYALTEEDGLELFQRETQPPVSPSFMALRLWRGTYCVDANQLKYVCKSLHQETKGIGLKFNDLHMTAPWLGGTRQVEDFEVFLHTCSPIKQSWFRRVTLSQESEFPDDVSHYCKRFPGSALAQFCVRNPSCEIKVTLNADVGWGWDMMFR
jgi:hypothetical protein